jgi:hypothetical protein
MHKKLAKIVLEVNTVIGWQNIWNRFMAFLLKWTKTESIIKHTLFSSLQLPLQTLLINSTLSRVKYLFFSVVISEAFTVTECNEVFSSDQHQPCKNEVVIQRFRDCLYLHHQGWRIYTCGWLSKVRQGLGALRASHRYKYACSRAIHHINPEDKGGDSVSKTLDYNSILAWLIAREDFILSVVESHKLICALLPVFE